MLLVLCLQEGESLELDGGQVWLFFGAWGRVGGSERWHSSEITRFRVGPYKKFGRVCSPSLPFMRLVKA